MQTYCDWGMRGILDLFFFSLFHSFQNNLNVNHQPYNMRQQRSDIDCTIHERETNLPSTFQALIVGFKLIYMKIFVMNMLPIWIGQPIHNFSSMQTGFFPPVSWRTFLIWNRYISLNIPWVVKTFATELKNGIRRCKDF